MISHLDKQRIEQYFHLNLENARIQGVCGGDVNTTFLMETTEKKFILKKIHFEQYVKEYRTNVQEVMQSIAFSESVCRAFAFLRHVTPAIEGAKGVLLNIHHYGYLLYPYVNGTTLENTQITDAMAAKMANILATVHNSIIDYDKAFSEKKQQRYREAGLALLDSPHLEKLRHVGRLFPWSRRLSRAITHLIHHKDAFKNAIHRMQNHHICHNDLKPKNVLWQDESQYWVIDWEAAADFDVRVDYLDTLIAWCLERRDGILSIQQTKIQAFILAYPVPQGTQDDEVRLLVLLKWYFWLYFCVSKAFKNPREFRHYLSHASHALGVIDLLSNASTLGFLGNTP